MCLYSVGKPISQWVEIFMYFFPQCGKLQNSEEAIKRIPLQTTYIWKIQSTFKTNQHHHHDTHTLDMGKPHVCIPHAYK